MQSVHFTRSQFGTIACVIIVTNCTTLQSYISTVQKLRSSYTFDWWLFYLARQSGLYNLPSPSGEILSTILVRSSGLSLYSTAHVFYGAIYVEADNAVRASANCDRNPQVILDTSTTPHEMKSVATAKYERATRCFLIDFTWMTVAETHGGDTDQQMDTANSKLSMYI